MSYTAAEITEKYDTFLICTSIIAAFLTPVAVVGNALVLTAILRNPSLRTPTNILLATMALLTLKLGLKLSPITLYLTSALRKMILN